MEYQMRHIGVMLCGKYCVLHGKEDDCLYTAYNMHWESHDFALPKLFKDRRWKLLIDTETEKDAGKIQPKEPASMEDAAAENVTEPPEGAADSSAISGTASQSVTLPGRSIRIYISEEMPKAVKRRQHRK